MEVLYKTEGTWTTVKGERVTTPDGVLNMVIKAPKELGGEGGPYTNPEQLFAVGYASCFGSAINLVAMQKRMKVEITVTARVSMGKKEVRGFQLAVEMDVNIPQIDQKDAEELVEEAHQICPYSNATRNNIPFSVKVTTK